MAHEEIVGSVTRRSRDDDGYISAWLHRHYNGGVRTACKSPAQPHQTMLCRHRAAP